MPSVHTSTDNINSTDTGSEPSTVQQRADKLLAEYKVRRPDASNEDKSFFNLFLKFIIDNQASDQDKLKALDDAIQSLDPGAASNGSEEIEVARDFTNADIVERWLIGTHSHTESDESQSAVSQPTKGISYDSYLFSVARDSEENKDLVARCEMLSTNHGG